LITKQAGSFGFFDTKSAIYRNEAIAASTFSEAKPPASVKIGKWQSQVYQGIVQEKQQPREGHPMLTTLISVGRFSVALTAFLLIVACTVSGGWYGSALGLIYSDIGTTNHPANGEMLGVLLGIAGGFVVGLLSAGSIFGLAAAVFDMQHSLRAIARTQGAYLEDEGRDEQQSMAGRIEPRV
jgi:hypothetical protein